MKILSAAQIRQWDEYTIKNEPINSFQLMQRASAQCTQWIIRNKFSTRPIKIICGKGNNGGDGLAMAGQLIELGILPEVYILEFGAAGTNDFQQNLAHLHTLKHPIHFLQDASFFPVIKKNDVVLDAIYGSGINRPVKDLSAALIDYINASEATVISIDLPSGMLTDQSSYLNNIISATHTLTFQSVKLCFMMAENEQFFGTLHVLPIGLKLEYLASVSTPYYMLYQEKIKSIYRVRKQFAHKGTYGHSLIIAGEEGKIGAAILSCKSCLRSGAGLVTAILPKAQFPILQTALPEAMVVGRSAEMDWKKYSCIGIGPGLGNHEDSERLVREVLKAFTKPIVVDADALNIISDNQDLLLKLPAHSILTPHPKEFERLFGSLKNDFERLEMALEKSREFNVFIVLKGHRTAIVFPDGKVYFNSTGNPGMATAGSGDVLTGLLTGLVAQGYSPGEACLLGVYIHGLAGDFAASFFSEEAMIARDIIHFFGKAFKQIAGKK